MTAVAFRLRSGMRARWTSTLGLVVLVAVLGGVVLALAAGAHRTMTAPDRFATAFGDVPDVNVAQQDLRPARTDELLALPSVSSVKAMTFLFAGSAGANTPSDTVTFAGSYTPAGVLLIAGRDPDPTKPDEFVASRSFVEQTDAKLGDTVDMFSLTQEEAQTVGFTNPASTTGPRFTGTLVGIVTNTALQQSTPTLTFSPALLKAHPQIGTSATLSSIWLRPGYTLDDLRGEINALPQSQSFTVDPGRLLDPAILRAVDAQAIALWLLVLVSGVAAVAVLGQVITRSVRLAPAEQGPLSGIGYTGSQGLAESLARAAIPLLIGSLIAVGVAVAPSGIFPTGFIRRIEPNPGLQFDALVLLAGAAVLVVALLVWVYVALLLAHRPPRVVLPSTVVEAAVAHTSSTSAATGARLVFTRRARDRGTPRAAIVGVTLAVAGLVAALVFGTSLDRLVNEPYRYGMNADAKVGDDGSDSLADELRQQLQSDPNVIGLVLLGSDYVRVGTRNVAVTAFQPVRGDVVPVVASGRLPVIDNEIAFGRITADDLGVGAGDAVTLEGATASHDYRVTGIVVVPGMGGNEGVGEGAVLTYAGLQRVNSNAQIVGASIRVADRAAAELRLQQYYGGPLPKLSLPEAILNVTRVRSVPFVLAGVLGALTLLIVANAVLASLRGRRRDLAILRALGADGSWVTRTVHWAATAFVFVPAVLGVLVGLMVGRVVFTAFADGMGTLDDPAMPALFILVVVVALVMLGNVIAIVPARRARRDSPAAALQIE